jgi:uncharacterized protein (UPF0548 family)
MGRVTDVPLWQVPVTYGAVGATQAVDLLQHPPAGYRAMERRARIGHGGERFEYAATRALSWGIQKQSGFRVQPVDAPAAAETPEYTPVGFDAAGAPVVPAAIAPREHAFTADGSELIAAGDTVVLAIPFGPFRVKAPARVVYVVDEPTRKGFAYGTLPGHPEDGEELFVVEHRDDDSVWITIRAFSRPSSRSWWAVYPVLRLSQEFYTRRYLTALAVPIE